MNSSRIIPAPGLFRVLCGGSRRVLTRTFGTLAAGPLGFFHMEFLSWRRIWRASLLLAPPGLKPCSEVGCSYQSRFWIIELLFKLRIVHCFHLCVQSRVLNGILKMGVVVFLRDFFQFPVRRFDPGEVIF